MTYSPNNPYGYFKYKGHWKNDKPNGVGTMKYLDGNPHGFLEYEGNWVDGVINGLGKMTYVDGNVREGEWQNGIPIH